jgi:hypothetical protein
LIVRADDYANKAVDVVESRYPYPFKVKPDDVANYVRETRQSAVSVANKTLDEKVKSPAINVAQGIDQKFAPIVDYFEVAVTRFNHNSDGGTSTSPTIDAKYQYQRAYALSVNLRDEIYVYSNEHLKQIQSQNALVHRATETAQTISELASSSITNAQTRIHALSDKMLVELQKVQSSTASFPTHLHSQLPPHLQSSIDDIQASFTDLAASLGATISDLRNIVGSDAPMGEKATKVAQEVRDKVSPLLERLANMVGVTKKKGEEVAQNGEVRSEKSDKSDKIEKSEKREKVSPSPKAHGVAKPKAEVAQNGSSGTSEGASSGGRRAGNGHTTGK